MSCKCEVCEEIKLFNKNLDKIEDEEVKKHFSNLYEAYSSLEMDKDRLKAIIDGTWPNADEQLRIMRLNYREEHAEDYV